jgi:hypothetical protein
MLNLNKKRNVLITLIDSGVDSTVSDMSLYVSDSFSIRINKYGCLDIQKDSVIHHIHGTVVSMVIRDICPDIKIRSINILDENLTSDGRILLSAMEFALSDPPDILHLSLGTTKLRYWLALKSLVKKAQRAGTVIVAAAENSGKRSYPAFFKGIAGVKSDTTLNEKTNFYYQDGFFYAPCEFKMVRGSNEIPINTGGNSIAAAFITGHFAKSMYTNDFSGAIDPVKSLICHNYNISN